MSATVMRAVGVYVAIVGAGVFAVACGRTEPPSPQAVAPSDSPGGFAVPAEQLPHLQMTPVRKIAWATTLTTTGTVDWDNDHTSQAITQVSGPITRIMGPDRTIATRHLARIECSRTSRAVSPAEMSQCSGTTSARS